MKTFPTGHEIFTDLFLDKSIEALDLNLFVAGLATEPTGGLSLAVHNDLGPEAVVRSSLEMIQHHIVQKNSERFEDEIRAGIGLIQNYQNYFEETYQLYGEPHQKDFKFLFSGPEDKAAMKDQVIRFAGECGSEAVLQNVDSIVEELYMNAVIDAPREAISLGIKKSPKPNQMYLARSKRNLQISCTDFCGSLDLNKLMNRMNEVYTKGAGQAINFASGSGAGLGCVILFENCVSLYFGVIPGVMTKVSCVIPLGVSNRQRERMKKSLHWFSL